MKKFFMTVLLLGGVFILAGCNMFSEGVENIWYDEMNETLNISYSISRPDKDDDTGEYPQEFIYLMVKYEGSEEWQEVVLLEDYKAQDLQIRYKFEQFGNVELKIERRDVNNVFIEASEMFNVYLNEPQFIHHFDSYFDSWSGEVRFNYGLNEMLVTSISIQKSLDGGLNWVDVFVEEPIYDDQDMMKYELKYYEYDEGNYVYRIIAFDENSEQLGEMNTWNEINVSYENKVFEGVPEIWNVGSSIDPYSRNVNVWWDSSGAFDEFVIEKSTDLVVWEQVAVSPRIASNINYNEDVDGEYYYRVSAYLNEEPQANLVTMETLRVKEGVLIGYINGWVEWDTQSINLNWDFYSETVEQVQVERKLNDGEFELVGEFGGLKKMHTDNDLLVGSYQYRITVLNMEDEILDQVESQEFVIEQLVQVYHLNAWHNQSTGEIEFNFGFNQSVVTRYVIEKSDDGGLTWISYIEQDVEMIENNWYVDHTKVYELTEGVYSYRITGFDKNDKNLGFADCYNEVVVRYENLNFDEPTSIYYLDGNYNIYDNSINLWWGSQGTYDHHLVEYSIDNENWMSLSELPRIQTTMQIKDLVDGEYYFRISAVSETNEVIDSYTTEHTIRVKEYSLIGSFNAYYEWNNDEIGLNWDIIKDGVFSIKVERKLVDEVVYSTIGEYGPLKTILYDNPTEAGTYIYKLTLLDENNVILDEMTSNEIMINE